MTDFAIRVENLGKRYRIGKRERYRALRDVITDGVVAPFRRLASLGRHASNGHANGADAPDTFWALKNISFEVQCGEVLGIIGQNGAGKSTLLKILSRITEPTEGRVRIFGRVGSLLEVGTGFHPELTGRENIFLNGAILGMKRADIVRQFDEIVAFAEVEKFIDTPVKHYSSGMYVRLAFAVAAHMEPEILIVDEVLAVGDAAFQKKCLRKMGEVAKGGRTVLFVSHNMAAIMSLCTRAILLNGGTTSADGHTAPVVDKYLQVIDTLARLPLAARTDRQGNQRFRFVDLSLRDVNGLPLESARTGQDIAVALKYMSPNGKELTNVHIAIGVHGRFDENLFHLSTSVVDSDFSKLSPSGTILCRIPRLPLQPGRYPMNLFATVGGDIADWIMGAGAIEVESGDFYRSGKMPPVDQGAFLVQLAWGIDAESDDSISLKKVWFEATPSG